MTQSIPERVCLIAGQTFNIKPDLISPRLSSDDVENWDSLGHLNLVLALEQEFRVRFSPEQIQQMMSLEAIIKILQSMDEHA